MEMKAGSRDCRDLDTVAKEKGKFGLWVLTAKRAIEDDQRIGIRIRWAG
jgi:hypothetical protein